MNQPDKTYIVDFVLCFSDHTWEHRSASFPIRSLGWRNEEFIEAYLTDNPVSPKFISNVFVTGVECTE